MKTHGMINKELSLSEYDFRARRLMTKKNNYSEQIKGSKKIFYIDNKMYFYTFVSTGLNFGSITDNQFKSFLGRFSKQLYGLFIKNPELYSINIDYAGAPTKKNYTNWRKIKDFEAFYNIDLKSAYWQIAHKLGYLNTKMFLKYLHNDDFKQAKRLCISFLSRENKKQYNDEYIISCDTYELSKVYKNIRYKLHEIIIDIYEDIKDAIYYNVDGIYVQEKDVDKVCSYFDNEKLLYSKEVCVKYSDSEYLHKGKIRKF